MRYHRWTRRRGPMLGLGLLVGGVALILTTASGADQATVGLGTAGAFSVLSGAGVTNTGPTVLGADVGTCPNPAITGFPPGSQGGAVHANDAVACGAESDVVTAYNDAAGRAPNTTFPGPTDLGGMTLLPGVYKTPSSFAITGTLTLDAQGDGGAVFIFQAGSTVITAPNSHVTLVNGASACNVFWQVGSSATLGVGSTFVGTILALTSITANTGAVVDGRLLARNGAVTLDNNRIASASCAAPTSTTTSTSTTSTSTTVPGGATTTSTSTTTPGGATTSTSSTTTPGGATTSTSSTTTPGGVTTTTVAGGSTTTSTTNALAPGAATTTVPGTTSTATTSTTLAQAATGTSSDVTQLVTGGLVEGQGNVLVATGVGGGATRTLARTGLSVRRVQFVAGGAMALGGLLLLLAQPGQPLARGRRSDG